MHAPDSFFASRSAAFVLTDPFKILGVSRTADIAEIKRAFRVRARQSHPDSAPGDPRAEEQFKTLLAAYEEISNAWNRRRLESEEALASGMAHEQTVSGFKVKGTDVTYTLAVGFEDAATGVTRSLDMVTGRKLAVKVPPGVFDGHILRLKGEGMPGMGGCARGDALVEVRVAPHPVFARQGHDIHVSVAVTLPEAVLGGRVEVPTVGGRLTVSVPPGSNTGSVLRLRAKGLPRGEEGCGDQYITLKVVLPSSPDDEFIQFVKRWQAEHPYTVRKP